MTQVTHHTIITDMEGHRWLSIFEHRGSHVCVEADPVVEMGKFPPRNVPQELRIATIRPSGEHIEEIELTIS